MSVAVNEGEDAMDASDDALKGFVLEKVLDQGKWDPRSRTASLLGRLDDRAAILLLEKTHFEPSFFEEVGSERLFSQLRDIGQNDVYRWLLGWRRRRSLHDAASASNSSNNARAPADFKMTLIHPASETHVAKYSVQSRFMINETPELYEKIVLPFILSQPSSRIQWVYNILDKKKEADSIIYEDPDPETGFVLLPDLKWDRKTTSSLYLVAIAHDRSLRSLRDLRPQTETPAHARLLRKVQSAAATAARGTYGLDKEGASGIRCFLHYQPTYYHLHIHILSADHTSHPGSIVGQAHLLDDVIDLLTLGVDFRKRTLTYALGERSELLALIKTSGALSP
ncbi:scavenger mRNA decapping enzyme [Ceraceosorus guamensis]|uniref:m7GpppX diphosphatase n=1 Tax=Ceraceosorus guamensis TaxID=1522189 RepID=A0A316VMM8_9BASI|nr:scavenger mRNA decapping enzyme [Ceraceosorus guamensis]PWN38816.1 scavenger mRNA decapping enzyme [Ceraceosorus guamensis]